MKKKISFALGLVLMVAMTGCGSSGAAQNEAPASAAQEETVSAENAEGTGAAAETIDPKTTDYSKVDVTIEYGDSDAAEEIASAMWYGEYDGKVVKIDGIAEHLGSWSIMEEAGEGSKVGFGFELVDSEDYPADGTRVELVGVIAPGGSMEGSRVLYVLPENMKPVS